MLLLWAGEADAQGDLSTRWSDGAYALHASLGATAFFGAMFVRPYLTPDDASPRFDAWFDFEESVQHNMSASAAGWSDRFLLISGTIPFMAHIGHGTDRQLLNHAVVYGQALGLEVLLHVIAKHAVRRARPYTHNPDRRVLEFRESMGNHAVLSFYSGHAGIAFVSAVAGSYLFGAKSRDRVSRGITWFLSMFTASASAHLRVDAGMHYYSDVIAGALIGSSIGVAIPYLHGNRHQLSTSDYLALSSGIVLGTAFPVLVSGGDIRLPWGDPIEFALAPFAVAGGGGLALEGVF